MLFILGTGYSNKEFSQPPVLKPARLSQWELFKAVQPERNFYYPKGSAIFSKKEKLINHKINKNSRIF